MALWLFCSRFLCSVGGNENYEMIKAHNEIIVCDNSK